MGLRKINATKKGPREAIVYRDSEWQEYRVKFFFGGVHQKSSDYHTTDKIDAEETGRYWVMNEMRHNAIKPSNKAAYAKKVSALLKKATPPKKTLRKKLAPKTKVHRPNEFPNIVETKTATGQWASLAAFRARDDAEQYARAYYKANPHLSVRLK